MIRIDHLKQAQQKRIFLQKQLESVSNQIEEIKTSLIIEKKFEPKTNQVKKMIEISDDREAGEKAAFLVRKLNYEKKMREAKKMKEMEMRDQQVKISIEDIKKDRVEKQDRLKYEKHQNIFERLDKHESKKLNLVSSEFNNVAFIKGLYKGSHYRKPLKDQTKGKIILPHIARPQDLYSFKLTPKKPQASPILKPISPPKKNQYFSKDYLAGRLDKEEKILIEREKILQEEKKILEERKKAFERKNETKKINKELGDIEKALFNYQSLKKYELSPIIGVNRSQDEIKGSKFLEYKSELRSWDFVGKSESPKRENMGNNENSELKIKKKFSKAIQASIGNGE